ncbi:cell division protein ZapE [Nocardia sp. NBC_00565]|uniref:cell division protein ZapE n=1 Tax=Nocardia sp. NBC_00565 TaxID=2975993 RepID=UPI002E81410E|nr:cell division protein ZapE [Nocardia sp. NBC_00565]WUC01531.1 cell division protein ZapE [Nocardia sp. NBC_00565]
MELRDIVVRAETGVRSPALILDADQIRARARLLELLDRHGRPRKHHRGVYLHGRPGRGKTMLMNDFFAGIASNRKRRFHFHDFFARLHTAAHESGSIDKAIDGLLGNAELVCFDEFHVHDIGDAMLIARMLDVLFAHRIVLVVTSNYPPRRLLPNPLFHDRFLPTIARIIAQLDLVSVDGPLDYRTRGGSTTGFAAGRYLAATGRDRSGTPTGIDIPVGTRKIRARAVDDSVIVIDFTALCGTATAASDYVDLAQRFRQWTLCDVVPLRDVPPDWAMRFVNLIDVLYDADLELTIEARTPLSDLVADVREVPDIARTASRLGELHQGALR